VSIGSIPLTTRHGFLFSALLMHGSRFCLRLPRLFPLLEPTQRSFLYGLLGDGWSVPALTRVGSPLLVFPCPSRLCFFRSAIGSRIWLRWMSVEPVWATLHYNSTFAACRLPLVFV